jgi:TolB-like protein
VRTFLRELKRRKVYTVGAAYILAAWVLLQVANTVLPIYDTPEWVLRAFTTLLFLGLPVALILAWAYELTPGGVARTGPPGDSGEATPTEPEAASNAGGGHAVELPSGPSIAVLPFRNLSAEPDQELFSQALTGDIITGLTQSSHLFVLAAGATRGIEQAGADNREAGKRLGVSYLLEGSVRKSGETLRVSAQLLDTGSGVQIWSQNYDRELSAANLFAVQDDIREQIVATLSDLHGVIYSTQSSRNVHRPTNSLNAYECLAVALAYDKQLTEENHLLARQSLERAVEIDPQFDEAWAHLSWIYTDEHVFGFNPLPDSMDRALAAARKGIELARDNYHNRWLLSRVHYFMGEHERFLAESQRALDLNSSDGTTLGLIGMYTAWAGDWQRGMDMMRKAKLLNPNYPDYYHMAFGIADYVGDDFDGALKHLLRAHLDGFPPYLSVLAVTHARLGHAEQAKQKAAALRGLLPEPPSEAIAGMLNRTFPFQPELVRDLCSRLEGIDL